MLHLNHYLKEYDEQNNINKKASKIRDVINLHNGAMDIDVCDTDIDMLVALCYDESLKENSEYDRFIDILADNVEVQQLRDDLMICKFSDFFKPYNEQLKEFFNMDNSEFDEDEAYYEAVANLEPLISGNCGESTYKELNDILEGKQKSGITEADSRNKLPIPNVIKEDIEELDTLGKDVDPKVKEIIDRFTSDNTTSFLGNRSWYYRMFSENNFDEKDKNYISSTIGKTFDDSVIDNIIATSGYVHPSSNGKELAFLIVYKDNILDVCNYNRGVYMGASLPTVTVENDFDPSPSTYIRKDFNEGEKVSVSASDISKCLLPLPEDTLTPKIEECRHILFEPEQLSLDLDESDDQLDIINPEDKDYANGKLMKVCIWSGAGYVLDTFYMYATDAETALEIAVADAEKNDPGVLITDQEVYDETYGFFKDDFEKFIQENGYTEEDYYDFATEYLDYVYVDATEHGASQPYFVRGENLRIEEVKDINESDKPKKKKALKEAHLLSNEDKDWLEKQGHSKKLDNKIKNFKPSGDVDNDENKLEDIAYKYFYDEVGIHNGNIEKCYSAWAHDKALDLNNIDDSSELDAYMDYELEDDNTPYGGVSFDGEKVRDFIAEFEDEIKTLDDLNKALKDCGIKPIRQKKLKESALPESTKDKITEIINSLNDLASTVTYSVVDDALSINARIEELNEEADLNIDLINKKDLFSNIHSIIDDLQYELDDSEYEEMNEANDIDHIVQKGNVYIPVRKGETEEMALKKINATTKPLETNRETISETMCGFISDLFRNEAEDLTSNDESLFNWCEGGDAFRNAGIDEEKCKKLDRMLKEISPYVDKINNILRNYNDLKESAKPKKLKEDFFDDVNQIYSDDYDEGYDTDSPRYIENEEYLNKIKDEFGYCVESIDGDPAYNDFWVYLYDGYISDEMECHTIHERSAKECYEMLKLGITEDKNDHNGYGKPPKLDEANSPAKQKFIEYCKDKIEDDLGKELVTVDDIQANVNIVMLDRIRNFGLCKVLDPSDCFEEPLSIDSEYASFVKENGEFVSTPMISTVGLAARMEFEKISKSFYRDILKYWDDFYMD